MRIAVIGAGAMGCLYGAYLSRRHEVTMIDNALAQVAAIAQRGITLEDGEQSVYPDVRACLSGQVNGAADLVIVLVKSTHTDAALKANQDLFQAHTLVLTLQNGAGNDRMIARYVQPENIIVGTSKHSAVSLGPGRSRHLASGATTIGSNHQAHTQVGAVAHALQQAGFEVAVSDDIQRSIWSELFVDLSVNAFTALTETPIGYMLKNPSAWNFAKRLVYEAVEVAEADGTYFDRREALEMVRQVCRDAGDGYSLMYRDRKRRVPMEIDAINGAIVEQAKLYGVPTPYNALIVDLIHAIEGAYAFYD